MSITTIRDVRARGIFDGGARPSIEVVVATQVAQVRAAPSYADARTSGKYEIEHFPKGGVRGSIGCINSELRDRLLGFDAADQEGLDQLLAEVDGTGRFERIGGNTAEGVSMAVAKAAAASLRMPLYRHAAAGATVAIPHQMPNIIGGGATMADSGWKGRTPDIQDHVVLPVGCGSAWEEMERVSEVFHRVGALLRDADPHYAGGRDEEYCWLPGLDDVSCLEILRQACEEVGQARGIRFRLGLDVGASDLWDESEGVYVYAREGVRRTPSEHAAFLAELVERFDLFYMEDSFFEDHEELYVEQRRAYGDRVLICGDDLLAGQLERLERLAERGAINAAVCKLNMAGTVTRMRRFVETCRSEGFATIGSCRTYDSPDDTLADLIVAWACNTYKSGSPAGGEHAAKFNRFIRIDEELGPEPSFAGFPGLRP